VEFGRRTGESGLGALGERAHEGAHRNADPGLNDPEHEVEVLTGIFRVDRGRISIGSSVVADGNKVYVVSEKRDVGYAAQDGALHPIERGRERQRRAVASERSSSLRVADMLDW
jgi:ssDNA-binding replication factor A large subunit